MLISNLEYLEGLAEIQDVLGGANDANNLEVIPFSSGDLEDTINTRFSNRLLPNKAFSANNSKGVATYYTSKSSDKTVKILSVVGAGEDNNSAFAATFSSSRIS